MILEVNPQNPQNRNIFKVADILESDGVIIYPTDTVYALGCNIFSHKGIEKLCMIRGIKPEKAKMSFICKDIAQIAEFTRQIDNNTFKILKEYLPGPYTFILNASNKLPRLMKNKKKTIGVRIPASPIVKSIIETLGQPILSMSLKSDGDFEDYFTDPIDIHEKMGKRVDLVVDGGLGKVSPSTVVDLTTETPTIIRQGAGKFDY